MIFWKWPVRLRWLIVSFRFYPLTISVSTPMNCRGDAWSLHLWLWICHFTIFHLEKPKLCFMYFCRTIIRHVQIYGYYIFLMYAFFYHYKMSLFLVAFLLLFIPFSIILSEITIAIPAFLCFLFVWHIFFHPFTLNPFLY